MIINSINNCNSPSFEKFIKVKDSPGKLTSFRSELNESSDTFVSFWAKKKSKNPVLYIISGKHLDKFIDLVQKNIYFRDLRTNPEKFLKTKPITLNAAKAKKKLL